MADEIPAQIRPATQRTERLPFFLFFTGFGVGRLTFGAAARLGFGPAFLLFAAVKLLAAVQAVPLFRDGRRPTAP